MLASHCTQAAAAQLPLQTDRISLAEGSAGSPERALLLCRLWDFKEELQVPRHNLLPYGATGEGECSWTSLLSIHRNFWRHFTLFPKFIWVQKSTGTTLRLVFICVWWVPCGGLCITLLKQVTSILGRKHWLSDLFLQSLQGQKFLWRMSQRN